MAGCADRHRGLSLRGQGLWLDRLNDERHERAEKKKVKPGFPVNSGFTFSDRHRELGPIPLSPVLAQRYKGVGG